MGDSNVLTTALVQKRISRKKKVENKSYAHAPKVIPGGAVICISRLPHGFFESELRAYLGQFGDITRLRLSRNPRTGASRHFAFVEFKHAEVASIVIETMHNYLLAGHLLQCKLIPEDKIHAELWKGSNRKFAHIPWRKMEMKRYNCRRPLSANSLDAKVKELNEKGIEYDFSEAIRKDLVL